MAAWASSVEPPMCGVRITLGTPCNSAAVQTGIFRPSNPISGRQKKQASALQHIEDSYSENSTTPLGTPGKTPTIPSTALLRLQREQKRQGSMLRKGLSPVVK